MVTATEAGFLPLGTILFDNTVLDLRKNFDISSGIFVVPRTGNYLMIIDGTATSDTDTYIGIMVNGVWVKDLADTNRSNFHTFSGMLPINLELGDEVALDCKTASKIKAENNYPFSFIGILVSEITTI